MTRITVLSTAAAIAVAGFAMPVLAGGPARDGHGIVLAQDNGSASKSAKTNKGGATRGLTRADGAAGAHGDKGRDRAAQNKTKKQ